MENKNQNEPLTSQFLYGSPPNLELVMACRIYQFQYNLTKSKFVRLHLPSLAPKANIYQRFRPLLDVLLFLLLSAAVLFSFLKACSLQKFMFIARWPWPEIIINCTVITAETTKKTRQNGIINMKILLFCVIAAYFGSFSVHGSSSPDHCGSFPVYSSSFH